MRMNPPVVFRLASCVYCAKSLQDGRFNQGSGSVFLPSVTVSAKRLIFAADAPGGPIYNFPDASHRSAIRLWKSRAGSDVINPSDSRMYHDELPHEVILAIQRVLELPSGQDADPLDALSNEFKSVDILNGFFPDGTSQPLGVFND